MPPSLCLKFLVTNNTLHQRLHVQVRASMLTEVQAQVACCRSYAGLLYLCAGCCLEMNAVVAGVTTNVTIRLQAVRRGSTDVPASAHQQFC
jgi:hypothetical protein